MREAAGLFRHVLFPPKAGLGTEDPIQVFTGDDPGGRRGGARSSFEGNREERRANTRMNDWGSCIRETGALFLGNSPQSFVKSILELCT